MNRIAKKALSVIIPLCLAVVFAFVFFWHYNGFSDTWNLFFGSDLLSNILSFVGVHDWLISVVVGVIIAGVFETLIGRRIKSKTSQLIADFASFIVSFTSIFLLLNNL